MHVPVKAPLIGLDGLGTMVNHSTDEVEFNLALSHGRSGSCCKGMNTQKSKIFKSSSNPPTRLDFYGSSSSTGAKALMPMAGECCPMKLGPFQVEVFTSAANQFASIITRTGGWWRDGVGVLWLCFSLLAS